LDPEILMMEVPVDMTAFAGVYDATAGTSAEKARVAEPTCHQTDTRTESFPPELCSALEMTQVSEIQTTSDVAVEP